MTSMPNALYRAKLKWEAGQMSDALALVNRHFEAVLGRRAFEPHTRLYSGAFEHFQNVLFAIANDPGMLRVGFGSYFTTIWNMDPDDLWIGLLLNYNFYPKRTLAEDEDERVVWEGANGFALIVSVLAASARKGILAPAYEGPNNGRPVLELEQIEAVPEVRWGPLKRLLLDSLPSAYDACPSDFWDRLAVQEPENVLERSLHDLFARYHRPIPDVQLRWSGIVRWQKAYARAILGALDRVLEDNHDGVHLTEIVRVDAGFPLVNDGRSWLISLRRALVDQDFSMLT
jgi:hypothetical protein